MDDRTETVATLRGVHHRYGAVHALRGMDLSVHRGEVLAVLGPNGAGKTTAISLLLGSLPVTQGEVRVLGRAPDDAEVRLRRGAMLQISGLPETLSVAEQVTLFSHYYPQPLAVDRVLAMAGISDLAERRFQALSGGQKQRLMFALALVGDPELVFLDEPTAGLDLEARRRLWEEIRKLRGAGRTVVLTTHYLEEADALADRIVVIHRGQVIAEGTPAEIKSRTAGRRVRCITSLDDDALGTLPGVVAVTRAGQHRELLTSDAEATVRGLLMQDDGLSDLEVTGAGLEEAFLALVEDGTEEEAA